jgi:pimeloyl-ACP methyl ester carboxylesterase
VSSGGGWVSERLQVGGDSIYCRRGPDRDGVPIVHVHGFAISGEYLMPTARLLARRRGNLVPDLPGYGRSKRRAHVLGIPELAEAPERVHRLVLVSPAGGVQNRPLVRALGQLVLDVAPLTSRVQEIARLAPDHLRIALIEKAAHAVNFSHPVELAGVIEAWLDDALAEGARLPEGVRLLST